MTRDRKLLLLAALGIVFAVFFFRSQLSRNEKPAIDNGSSVQTPAPTIATGPPMEGVAAEDAPKDRSAEDQAVIDHAKDTPVSMLDSSLPHQSVGYWIAHNAGGAAKLRWEVNDCSTRNKQPDSVPVCAQANVELPDGAKFQALLLLGNQPFNPHGPVQYAQPSLLWAAYQKRDGALTPASLSLLPRLAHEAN